MRIVFEVLVYGKNYGKVELRLCEDKRINCTRKFFLATFCSREGTVFIVAVKAVEN